MFKVTVNPKGYEIDVLENETVFEALQRQGYTVAFGCKNGVCELCEAQLIAGKIYHKANTEVTANDHAETILVCVAKPQSDLIIELQNIFAPGELPLHTVACQIRSVQAFNESIYKVQLLLPAGKQVKYLSGQYLEVVLPSGEACAYSIASAPQDGRHLELHIRHNRNEETSKHVIKHFQDEPMVNIRLPMGDCFLSELPNGPIILVATTTGFSQIQSILKNLFAKTFKHPIHFYWGARHPSDLYLHDQTLEWANQYQNFHYTPVLRETLPHGWKGSIGSLHDAILQDFADLSDTTIYTSGTPDMVYTTLDALVEKGLKQEQMKSDVFAYAPRS